MKATNNSNKVGNRQWAVGNKKPKPEVKRQKSDSFAWASPLSFTISCSPVLRFPHCLLLTAYCLLLLTACNSDFVQKERGYFKIDFPEKKYRVYDQPGFPYTFEYPVYASVISDSTFFDEKAENPYWVNVVFPQFDGELHLSYKDVGRSKFDTLVNDAFKLAYKQHTSIASAIQPVKFELPGKVSGIYFSLRGNAATANQFFATDSVRHFLRGSLYFNVPPNEDSLRPVNNFLREDMQHLINTLRWR